MPAIAFTTDSSLLTAAANDFGYETVFSRQVEALCKPGDVAVDYHFWAEPNVTLALETARDLDVVPTALTGKDGGDLVGLADPVLIVPSYSTAQIENAYHLRPDVMQFSEQGVSNMSIELQAQIRALKKARVVCVGDVMLDRFVYGDVLYISGGPIPLFVECRRLCNARWGRERSP